MNLCCGAACCSRINVCGALLLHQYAYRLLAPLDLHNDMSGASVAPNGAAPRRSNLLTRSSASACSAMTNTLQPESTEPEFRLWVDASTGVNELFASCCSLGTCAMHAVAHHQRLSTSQMLGVAYLLRRRCVAVTLPRVPDG